MGNPAFFQKFSLCAMLLRHLVYFAHILGCPVPVRTPHRSESADPSRALLPGLRKAQTPQQTYRLHSNLFFFAVFRMARQYGLLSRHFCTQICSEKLLDGGV